MLLSHVKDKQVLAAITKIENASGNIAATNYIDPTCEADPIADLCHLLIMVSTALKSHELLKEIYTDAMHPEKKLITNYILFVTMWLKEREIPLIDVTCTRINHSCGAS